MTTTPTTPPIALPLDEVSVAPSAAPVAGLRLPTAGEQFDKYTLLAKLATGGMAELFVAELSGAAGFSKKVVIKRILPHVAHDEHFTRMFLDEAMTCAQINHPNVCQVFELCESQGTHFLVLEHLEGATVGELIRRSLVSEQQLNMLLAGGIVVQACDGLHAAHEQVDEEGRSSNLVHRDVSPGNLFVTVDGIVKVLDFGIAKARWMSRKTKTGTLLGKCEYMSPEQARGGVTLDRRSDIFSLGIIAWELVCGKRLFRRESEYETLRAVLRAPIERPRSLRPSVPPALDEAIMRALERDPGDRYRTAYEFRQAISSALRDSGGPTPMCDIAPLIRSSFQEELRIQRAVLKQAARSADASSNALPRLSSLPPENDGDENFANTDVLTAEHQRLPSVAHEPEDMDSVELTFRVLPKEAPGTIEDVRADDAPALAPQATRPSDLHVELHAPPAKPMQPPQAAMVKQTIQEPAGPKPLRTPPVQQSAPKQSMRRSRKTSSPPPVPGSPIPATARSTTEAAVFSVPNAPSAVVAPIAAEVSGPVRDGRATVLLLALTLLLGAAVTTGSLMFFSKDKGNSQSPPAAATTEAPVAPANSASPGPAPSNATSVNAASSDSASSEQAPARTAANSPTAAVVEAAPRDAGTPNSAVANAAARAELLQANQKAKAVVTSLPATADTTVGTIEIRSTEVGKVYLYPEKTLLGTTPLTHALPPGRHKFKLEIGPSKTEKKYFYLKVEADEKTLRNFDHW